jgi:ubiquitin-conjugating enzyme E2 J2
MSSDLCVKRLEREYLALKRSPPALVLAAPLEKDIRQWLFVLDGPADTPYAGGQYLGTITFPATYPYAPPSIRMLTPTGRFVPNERICLFCAKAILSSLVRDLDRVVLVDLEGACRHQA